MGVRLFSILAGAVLALGPTAASAQRITVLSSRPDTVSDGDALVAVYHRDTILNSAPAWRSQLSIVSLYLVLNEAIGGLDDDGEFQRARTAASPIGLRRMFETGRINQGGNLDDIPVIDLRGNPVLQPNVHDAVNSEIMRARMLRANGQARGHVMVRGEADPTAPGSGTVPGSPGMDRFALLKMDEWLSNIAADRRPYPSKAARVVANRPADLTTDVCIMAGGARIDEASSLDNKGRCGARLPYFSEPRLAAGEPLTRDILKCRLRPFRIADYPGMAPELAARLGKVFATGVCDYSRPSIGYRPFKGAWLAYPAPGVTVPMR